MMILSTGNTMEALPQQSLPNGGHPFTSVSHANEVTLIHFVSFPLWKQSAQIQTSNTLGEVTLLGSSVQSELFV